MRDRFADFDRNFARRRRSFTILFRVAVGFVALIWAVVIGAFLMFIITLNRAGLDGVASAAGRLVSVFLQAAGTP